MGHAAGGWVFADTWIFAAIAINGRRCSLSDVVGAADMIHDAIPRDTEIEIALGKLIGAGFVRVFDDWTFEVTDEGTSLWFGGSSDLKSHLDAVASTLAAIDPGETRVQLPRGALDSAVEDYRRHVAG